MVLKLFTRLDGLNIWINPDHVISAVEAKSGPYVGVGTRISTIDSKFETVKGKPEDVVASLLDMQ